MQQRTFGFGLLILGIIMLAVTGFNFITREKVVDLGPVKITRDVNHKVLWPPIVGALLCVTGLIVVVRDYKHRL